MEFITILFTYSNFYYLIQSLFVAISNITGDPIFRSWAVLKFPNYLLMPTDLGKSLHLHMIACEYAHNRLCKMRDLENRIKNPK